MSAKIQLLIAIAALAFASASSAGASQRDNAIAQLSVAPIAALAGDIRPASDIVPGDLGTPSLGNAEQPIAKTGLFSSIKNADKKVGGAVGKVVSKIAKSNKYERYVKGTTIKVINLELSKARSSAGRKPSTAR